MLAAIALLLVASRNPLSDPNTFPIAVWLQEPSQAARYLEAGFNLYVGLWQGPTEKQLSDLKLAGMPVICEQNALGLKHKSDPTIVGWMHQDEPDNAQEIRDAAGKPSYGPCVPPSQVVGKYRALKAADPSRPVMLNLGQGVANDQWIGRGNGSKLDDYKTYVNGCDIVSFDVYPIAGLGDPGKIGLIGKGLDRLRAWAGNRPRIWNCLECTAISGKSKATPDQVKAEAWLSIIHGSRGLIYFVHQFEPKFNEHALLDDPLMLRAVTDLNRQIEAFAPVLNDSSHAATTVTSSNAAIDAMSIAHEGSLYVFAVSLSQSPVRARLQLGSHKFLSQRAEVVGGKRYLDQRGGELMDEFNYCQVNIYKIPIQR
jgi:hypothetical protein